MPSKKRKNQKIYCYYSFLSVLLLLFTFFLCKSVIVNVVKIVDYKAKLEQLTITYNDFTNTKKQLEEEIDAFGSLEAYEKISREKFKMAESDDIIVVVVPKGTKTEMSEYDTLTNSITEHTRKENLKCILNQKKQR